MTTNDALRSSMNVRIDGRPYWVLAVDTDPTALVWVVSSEDPDADRLVRREQIEEAR